METIVQGELEVCTFIYDNVSVCLIRSDERQLTLW